MKLVSFVYCAATEDNAGENIIRNPFQMIITKYLPTNYSFFVSFGIFDVQKEGFDLQISFVDPDEKVISNTNLKVPDIPEEVPINKNLPIGMQINFGFNNVELVKEGEYNTIVRANGEELGRYSINVVQTKKDE